MGGGAETDENQGGVVILILLWTGDASGGPLESYVSPVSLFVRPTLHL